MDWKSISEKMGQFYGEYGQFHIKITDFWKANILFCWRWWLLAAFAVLPWAVWMIVRKKECTDRLLFAGFFVALLATVLDGIGVSLGLWQYPVILFPMIPEAFPFNASVLPVVTMMFIQYFPKIKPIWKALVFGLTGAFLFEQILEWLGLYTDISWHHIYTFPLLFALYLLANRLATRTKFAPL